MEHIITYLFIGSYMFHINISMSPPVIFVNSLNSIHVDETLKTAFTARSASSRTALLGASPLRRRVEPVGSHGSHGSHGSNSTFNDGWLGKKPWENGSLMMVEWDFMGFTLQEPQNDGKIHHVEWENSL